MRDGVNLSVDVYRPKAGGKFPALLAFSIYNKDLQGPEVAEGLPRSRPGRLSGQARSKRAIRIFRLAGLRAYHRLAPRRRQIGQRGSRQWDSYDLIEWIAKQPWCMGE